jgi:hypothetical protein
MPAAGRHAVTLYNGRERKAAIAAAKAAENLHD